MVIDLDVKNTVPPTKVVPDHLDIGQPTVANGAELFGQVARLLGGCQRVTTYTVRTATGGYHAYFQADGARYTCSKGEYRDGRVLGLGWSIDVRATGGYVVAPGSTTRAGAYTVVRDLPILPLPDWLDRWLTSTGHREGTPGVDQRPRAISRVSPPTPSSATRAQRYALAALAGKCEAIATMAPVPHTGRDSALNRASYAAGGFVAAGALEESTAVDALTEAGLACGLSERAVERTVKSGMAAGTRKPSAFIGGVA